MKFHIVTFGCQMNVNDSDWLSRTLRSRGHEEVAMEEAEIFILNTCSVRDKPEQKVYSQIGRLEPYTSANPKAFVAVGGCVAQQVGEKFWQRFPTVRLVFGTDNVPNVPQALDRLMQTPGLRMSLLDFSDHFAPRDQHWPDTTISGQAFVTIMQGCDNFCTYCIVPYVRGRQKSRPADEIITECETLLARGVSEITLLGQNVNSYGQDKHGDGTTFAELLHRVAALPGLRLLRFVTSHPKDIAPEVIRAFGELPQLAPFLHLPVQSGSDRILKAMNRKYDTSRYLEIVRGLRQARPDIALSTDFIVGFPGETEEDFQATMTILEEVGFVSSFSFKYSDRPGVAAEMMKDKVDEETKSRRLDILQTRQNEMKEASYEALVGKTVEIVVEQPSRIQKPGVRSWSGRDNCGRVVNFDILSDDDLTGRVGRVTILQAKKNSLSAKPEADSWLK